MRVERRNLFVTLRMLRTAGIEAGARVVGERIYVFLKNPERGEPPLAASFGGAHIVRAFNAISYARLSEAAHRQGELVGVPIAGDDPHALAIASNLIREIGFEPVVVGGLAMGKYLVPGTPLAGEHTAAEIRQAVTSLH